MPRVVIAPDKFRGSLTATEVAAHLATGLRAAVPGIEVTLVPVADGGEGTVDAAVAAGFDRVPAVATGPTGAPVETSWARRGGDAVVELAAVSGLDLLPHGSPAPLTATSRGTGELVAAALAAGCTRVVVGIGGSAGTDGGAGLLRALGLRTLDTDGRSVAEGGAALADVDRVVTAGLGPHLGGVDLVVACDVDNPLTGPSGAAHVYGPQKGATPGDVSRLDDALAHWADLVASVTGVDRREVPGAGAAGGVGFGLLALAGARTRPGADLVFELTGLGTAVAGADLVITGEGSLDAQSLRGKAPTAVARLAREHGVPVVAVVGRSLVDAAEAEEAGFAEVLTTTDEAGSVEASLADPGPALERIGHRLGLRLAERVAASGANGTNGTNGVAR
ncbi:glycerate kinase [Intrasporangium sp. YIM S08009]|uniref:glycerate kinase n=1 Tax=Intrasporangium zincisolvens TaxID=3080018 RepID=UPI002B053373|nr:glycerate kinase [Intrasporangium sp. YIM S08009]